jgi:serine/threonine-protein kinase HipA
LVAGEGRLPGQKHLLELAQVFGIAHPDNIIEQVKDVLSNWGTYAKKAGLSTSSRKRIGQVINLQLKR